MGALLVVVAWVVAALLVAWLVRLFFRWAAKTRYGWIVGPMYDACRLPAVAVLVIWALLASVPAPTDGLLSAFRHGLLLAFVAACAWLAIRFLQVTESLALGRLAHEPTANRRQRRIRTQVRLIRGLTAVIVTLTAIAVALMSYEQARVVGVSLVTSAGVIGVLIGVGARTSLTNAFAGMQIAFTDAIHVDDVVVVDGAWGRVEEVKLTSVVIRMWDERRLILPTTYFTDRPFQNWTRHEARVVGEIRLHLDYTAEVDQLRREARRLVEESPLWDRALWTLQVVDVTPQTMEVQVRVSAADGPSAWDLRCDLREGLVKYVRDQHPQWLPRTRSEYQP
ncbi:mechanosensitive ion channel family protein [Micromonospora deserti]|uniref:Mechanosensitive ion channel protein MscS n=1 Tax=Micromonospora deserti TaxID=2070366 RepID=A0A2W2CMU2_9ACTN|nr:mechanosensitive ion channel domain-containing protein [Micromonospora deserti]PZG00852.1 mechanosensitive ion channel protein MscS [Micromonospora deserti]